MSLKKDIIGAEVQIGSNEAQKSLVELAQKTSTLTNENDRLRISQAKLKAVGKEHKEEYDKVTAAITENNKSIKENKSQMDALRKTIGLTEMSFPQLRKRAAELRKDLLDMGDSADPVQFNKLNKELIDTERQMGKVKGRIGETRGFMGQLGNSLTSIPGPVGAVIQSIHGMGKALWALVANPIGATIAVIVGSLMLLYKAFTSTDDGAKNVEAVLKSIGNVMDILIDRSMSYYNMLWSLVTFDWEGVKANAKDAFGGIGDAVVNATNAGLNYVDVMDDIEDREAASVITAAKLKLKIDELTVASKNVNLSTKERVKLAQEAMDKTIELNNLEKGFMVEKNKAELDNLATKINSNKLSEQSKRELLASWLELDHTQLNAEQQNNSAFKKFYNENTEEFKAMQKAKASEIEIEINLIGERKRLQKSLFGFEKDLRDEDKKLTDDARKKRIESLEAENSSEMGLIKKRFLEGKTTEDQYNAELLIQEMNFLSDKANVYKVGSKEYEEAQMQLLEKQVLAETTVKDLILQANKELANARIENLADGIAKEKTKEEQRWQEELAGLRKQLNDKKDLKEQDIALNDAINKTIQEKEKAHQKTINDLDKAGLLGKQMDHAIYGQAKARTDKELWTAEKEMARAQYAQELKDAKGNAAKIAQAERKLSDELIRIKQDERDKREAVGNAIFGAANTLLGGLIELVGKETALGKALFLFQQAAAVGQVIFNTAMANSKAVETFWMTGGMPWVAINTATAAGSIASIMAQTISGFKGKKAGGYTDRAASDDKIVDFVHANEFVGTANAVRNPTVKPVFDIIKLAEEQGTIATLNLPAVMASGGLQSGGYSSPPSSGSGVPDLIPVSSPSSDPELTSAINNMSRAVAVLVKNGVQFPIYTFKKRYEEISDLIDQTGMGGFKK